MYTDILKILIARNIAFETPVGRKQNVFLYKKRVAGKS